VKPRRAVFAPLSDRHQKVIEKTPPVELSRRFLAALARAAERFVRHVGYVGLGTVKLLVCDRRRYFLENPCLLVEHGLTEVVTGLALA
jgi:pyruvate carboxylase